MGISYSVLHFNQLGLFVAFTVRAVIRNVCSLSCICRSYSPWRCHQEPSSVFVNHYL